MGFSCWDDFSFLVHTSGFASLNSLPGLISATAKGNCVLGQQRTVIEGRCSKGLPDSANESWVMFVFSPGYVLSTAPTDAILVFDDSTQ